jgi:hypothetical protein
MKYIDQHGARIRTWRLGPNKRLQTESHRSMIAAAEEGTIA